MEQKPTCPLCGEVSQSHHSSYGRHLTGFARARHRCAIVGDSWPAPLPELHVFPQDLLAGPSAGHDSRRHKPFLHGSRAAGITIVLHFRWRPFATHAGSLVGPASLYPGKTTPARPGETIVIYPERLWTDVSACVKAIGEPIRELVPAA